MPERSSPEREKPEPNGTLEWRDYIHSDPEILHGKPVIRGTRLSVSFILDLFAGGWTVEDLLAEYPNLTVEAIQAAFAYASEQVAAAIPQLVRS